MGFLTYENELPSQTVQGDGSVSGVPVRVTLSFLSPVRFTSCGGTVSLQARYPVGVSHDFNFARLGVGVGLPLDVNHFVAGTGVHL